MRTRIIGCGAALTIAMGLLATQPALAARIYIDFGDGNFDASGNNFFNADSAELDLTNDGSSAAINLGFTIDFGSGALFNSLFLNENGVASFGSALGAFTSVAALGNLGVPVAAPFYTNFNSAAPDGDILSVQPGEIFYSAGFADPLADGTGAFSVADQVAAFRATWYGLSNASDPTSLIYTQLYLYSAGGNDFDMRFTYGNPDVASPNPTPALDSLAGFALGPNTAAVAGPFPLAQDYFYSFRGGRLVGAQEPPTTVPEPPTWALMAAALLLLPMFRMFRRHHAQ